MTKKEIYTLDNGLTVIFYKDSRKHSAVANLMVKYGGMYNRFITNGKTYNIVDGMAHFIEHLLIEHSKYGNILLGFRDDYIDTNGLTSSSRTCFYIDTVHDFEENLIKLIKAINDSEFTEDDIEQTKYAILEEVRKSNDNKFRNLDKCIRKSLFKNINYASVLGTIEDVKSIDYKTAKLCYDVFYQPQNQILAISGNVDIEKTKKIIEDTYNEIKKDKIDFSIPDFNEPADVVKKEDVIKDNTEDEYTAINYKIDISNLSNYDKVKLTFYLNYFLEYNFGESSKAYKNLLDNKISFANIKTWCTFIDKFAVVEISTYTNKKDEFVKLVTDTINNKEFDEEDFNLRKNSSIISLILREENPIRIINPLIENIISFNYYDIDKIEDIESQTFEDYKKNILLLDYSKYSINTIIKKD